MESMSFVLAKARLDHDCLLRSFSASLAALAAAPNSGGWLSRFDLAAVMAFFGSTGLFSILALASFLVVDAYSSSLPLYLELGGVGPSVVWTPSAKDCVTLVICRQHLP